jgi:hypothetical protein
MENGIAMHGNLSREYFVIQINGRTDSIHRRYEDAVRAGLLLKNRFPHVDIKVPEVDSIGRSSAGNCFALSLASAKFSTTKPELR